ncbi:MAG: hypothetical protein H5U03_10005 [Clostridia bacterium]|nr:hypothetical protein [Clostridia bacterium]
MMLHYAFTHGGIVNGYWWWYLPPVFCISLAVLGFALLGYAGINPRGSDQILLGEGGFFGAHARRTEGAGLQRGAQGRR